MVVFDLKKRFIISLVLLTLSLSLFVAATWSWFTQLIESEETYIVGHVEVEFDAYFYSDNIADVCLDGKTNCIEPVEVQISESLSKPGVFQINIVDNNSPYFLENFRLDLIVKSSVDTYFRIKIFEQLTLTYLNYNNEITELSILNDDYMRFNYDFANWVDRRDIDNSLYYTQKVKRTDALNPRVINLITSYFPTESFPLYDPGYSFQIAFSLEAVQAYNGPQNAWGLPLKPWDSTEW